MLLCFPTAEISIVICDNNTKVKNLLSRHAETPGLKSIVLMEDENEEITKTAKELGVDLIKFKTLMVICHFSELICSNLIFVLNFPSYILMCPQ